MERRMKAIFFLVSAVGLVLGYTACERQSWEETRALHLKHEAHGDDGEAKPAEGDHK